MARIAEAEGPSDGWPADTQGETRAHLLWGVAAFLLLTAFYVLTSPANHSEADDAFWYAFDVERQPWSALLQPFHILYLPIGRGAWRGMQWLGGPDRSFPALVIAGAAFASSGVLVSRDLLIRRLQFQPRAATIAVGLLAFSYGIWRYAGEAEVYALAFLVSAILAHLALAERPSRAGWIGLIVAGALAPLVHILAIVGSVIAVPAAIWSRRGWRSTAKYTGATALLGLLMSIVGYLLASRPAEGLIAFYRGGQETFTFDGAADLVRHAIAVSQIWVSGNFVLSFAPARTALLAWFPGTILDDEFYAATAASPVIGILGLVTLALLVGGVAWYAVTAGRPKVTPARRAAIRLGAAWVVGHVIVGVVFSRAGQPELWMLALFPAWLLAVSLLVRRAEPVWPLAAVVLALMLHNGVGGLWTYSSEEGDRSRSKAAWLVEQAAPSDVVLTAESALFSRYLAYWSPATVVDLQLLEPDSLRAVYRAAIAGEHRVFATGDVFDPPQAYRIRNPTLADSLARFMANVRTDFELVTDDEFGGLFRYVPKSVDADPAVAGG